MCGYISIIEIYYYYNNAVEKLFQINLISECRAAAVRQPEKKTSASSYNEISVIHLITKIIIFNVKK